MLARLGNAIKAAGQTALSIGLQTVGLLGCAVIGWLCIFTLILVLIALGGLPVD